MTECYVGLGGNFPQTKIAMQRAVQQIALLEGASHLISSPLYRTTPVSEIPQPPFLNAVCKFSFENSAEKLWESLRSIEHGLGKVPKMQDAPRLIDLDLLFFGEKVYHSETLILPHPRWQERLFVLAPLADVTTTIPLGINVKERLKTFSNPHQERVEQCGTLI